MPNAYLYLQLYDIYTWKFQSKLRNEIKYTGPRVRWFSDKRHHLQDHSHSTKETWKEWGPSVPVWLLNACWEVFDEISQMCSLGKHNQVETLALFLSCQHTSPVNLRDTQVWVCNLPYAGCYQICLQTRTLQLLKFIESMPDKGWSVNRAPPNHFRSCITN